MSLLSSAALAQQSPYTTVEQQATNNDLDNDYTPVAKQANLWTLVHGTRYPRTKVLDGSITTFDTELSSVAFRNRTIGLVGGSTCAITPVQQPAEPEEDFGIRARECTAADGSQSPRVPALYRYTEPPNEDPRWERLSLSGDDASGYIGAITWIDSQRALIVGGSGTYPRRELGPGQTDQYGRSNSPTKATDPDKADPAGKARAWLYTRSADAATELDLSRFTPDVEDRAGMRGLTAVGCYSDPTPGKHLVKDGESHSWSYQPDPKPDLELCFAGALGQIWEWRAGGFTGKSIDAQSTEPDVVDAALFRYRVHDIAFTEAEPPRAVSVTAGCCSSDPNKNRSQNLVYIHDATWNGSPPNGYEPGPSRWMVGQNDNPELPDSYYALRAGAQVGNAIQVTVIASPGGPKSANEAPSARQTYVLRPGRPNDSTIGDPLGSPGLGLLGYSAAISSRLANHASQRYLSTARLVSASAGWYAGELRSSERVGLGAQGLAFSTNQVRPTTQSSIDTRVPAPDQLSNYDPLDEERLDQSRRAQHYLTPSYALNAVQIVGNQEDGWAVGDRGAILRLSQAANDAAARAQEPKPPHLGQRRSRPLSERDAYVESKPGLPSEAGTVPAIGGARTLAAEPEMVPAGATAGVVVKIVMSRDGSEGWTLGNDTNGAVFTYYDGMRWRRCDPIGVPGVTSPDPACAAMAPLRSYRNSFGTLAPVRIRAAARVPLENDSDPTNDDELEIIAIGSTYSGPETNGEEGPAVLRYRNGRWRLAEGSITKGAPDAVQTLAFTTPDDAWASTRQGNEIWQDPVHFDGERWHNCAASPSNAAAGSVARCGNTAARNVAGPEPFVPGSSRVRLAGVAAAGERAYIFGMRQIAGALVPLFKTQGDRWVPAILYRDPGGAWTDGAENNGDAGGLDPGFADPATTAAGKVASLSVVEGPNGYEGWAVGAFRTDVGSEHVTGNARSRVVPPSAALLRLSEDGWHTYRSPGALDDYFMQKLLQPSSTEQLTVSQYPQVTHSSGGAAGGSFVGQTPAGDAGGGRILGFDATDERFELLDSARPAADNSSYPYGDLSTMASDGNGGFWAAVSGYLFHYTNQIPRPVFEETVNPLGIRGVGLRDISAGPDGSVWLATNSDRVYRHDRLAGWEEARVPGWDPGRVVVRASEANAIAIGPGGEGLLVGEGGRIAELSGESVALDPASGRSCALGEPSPCSSARELTAVDIAPDGSAIAAGERMTLLWRPSGGEFESMPKPPIASSTDIVALSYPTPNRVYLATSAGIVFRGDMSSPTEWRWRKDNATPDGEALISEDSQGKPIPIRDIAVDDRGNGYAVGGAGLVLALTEDGGWRRLPANHLENLTSVELAPGGEGLLIGGRNGLILTGSDSKLEVARPGDFPGNFGTGNVRGFAYLPGSSEGSVDAWAAVGGVGTGEGDDRLLRYRSDLTDPLLDPARVSTPLPDAPPSTEGELAIGAFGKSDCDQPDNHLCPEFAAATTTAELISERIVDELASLRETGELDLALQTGDAVDSTGYPASSLADSDRLGVDVPVTSKHATTGQLKHRRYAELVVEELEDKSVPTFAAIGGQDLSDEQACDPIGGNCRSTKEIAPAGENFAWREAFAGQAEPWGRGFDAHRDETEMEFVPAPGSADNAIRVEDQSLDVDSEGAAPEANAQIGGASTHYAFDAARDGKPVARIVVVDSSMRSLSASDPFQQPQELGGQARFLERMLCKRGQTNSTGDRCTREPGQATIVVSNTPTYSYGPGALTHTATDATTFEALLLRYGVDLIISGALGYNGLYYTVAPGVHEPCPGGSYPTSAPKQLPSCGAGADDSLPGPTETLAEQGLTGAVPTLIASGAGGKFGPDGTRGPDGPAGQWHGYSLARLMPDGEVLIEQRPILDWIGLDAQEHTLEPNGKLTLNGYGRSPISTSIHGTSRAFHYEISNAAITHRYDLLLADSEQPWLPCEAADPACAALQARLDARPGDPAFASGSAQGDNDGGSHPDDECSPYLCLPKRIGTFDRLSGEIRAGNGKYPDTFAVAMLSVDDKAATWPLYFKRSPAFVVNPAAGAPAIPGVPAGTGSAPPPPQPPNPPQPSVPQPNLPQAPALPGVPPLAAAQPLEPQPPTPPAPPPPTEQPSPLSLALAPPGIAIATPTAVIQPPTPPVNPAPPGGARREARQRQAATQKSGADSDASQGEGGTPDALDSRTQPMRRRARGRPEPSFTTFAHSEQPSAWAQGALYSGGITLMALALAAGWTRGRPTPRRRLPEAPAPAYSRSRRRY